MPQLCLVHRQQSRTLEGIFQGVFQSYRDCTNSKIPAAKRAPKMKIPGMKKKSGHRSHRIYAYLSDVEGEAEDEEDENTPTQKHLSHIRPSSSHRAEGPVRLREAARLSVYSQCETKKHRGLKNCYPVSWYPVYVSLILLHRELGTLSDRGVCEALLQLLADHLDSASKYELSSTQVGRAILSAKSYGQQFISSDESGRILVVARDLGRHFTITYHWNSKRELRSDSHIRPRFLIETGGLNQGLSHHKPAILFSSPVRVVYPLIGHCLRGILVNRCFLNLEPADTSKQPIRTRYLGYVTGYQPIRDHYFLIRLVPEYNSTVLLCKINRPKQVNMTNQNSLFRSLDWLSANQGPLFPDSVGSLKITQLFCCVKCYLSSGRLLSFVPFIGCNMTPAMVESCGGGGSSSCCGCYGN
eukprot:sb/3465150/